MNFLGLIFLPHYNEIKPLVGRDQRQLRKRIGLSLCKQIVMLHRGTIQVHSMNGKGTVFSLQF